jgi:predicted acyltransferase
MNGAAHPPGARLRALDAFRGATVAGMILVNNPGTWKHLYPPLAHAPWHGLTPTDLVFPFFLFAVGNALAITLPALLQQPAAQVAAKVARRTALIFLIGLLLNWSPFVRWDAAGELVPRSLETLRIMGVLQRIALAWGAAALLLWAAHAIGRRQGAGAGRPDADVRVAVGASAVLLLAYWLYGSLLARLFRLDPAAPGVRADSHPVWQREIGMEDQGNSGHGWTQGVGASVNSSTP